jgi:putative glutamine amidotransferase
LKVTARTDGLIEGIESGKHRFVVGVQWHPERISSRPEQSKLFRAFVQAARA